ncbi:MAG: hypothetical protein RLZ37_2085 [Actinomycetota bacterium]|jgi:hypothetical protein
MNSMNMRPMNALAARRRRVTWTAFVVGAASFLTIPVGSVVAWRAVRDSRAAEEVVSLPLRTIPSTPTAIFATVDERNALSALSVLALGPDGAGGTVMLMPLNIVVPGQEVGGLKTISQVFSEEGEEGLKLAIENITNSQIDLVSVNDVDDTGDLLARVGTIIADFVTDITDSELNIITVIAEAGENRFAPIQAAAVLASLDTRQVDSQRTPQIRAIWDGIQKAVASGRLGAEPVGVIPDVGAQVPADMMTFMSGLFAGPINIWQIDAIAINSLRKNPESLDVYEYDPGEVISVMASMAPSAMVAVFPTLNVSLSSPYPDVEVTRSATERLLYMAANVMLVRQVGDVPPPVTIIRYFDETDRALSENLSLMLGEIVFEKAAEGIEGVDIQVILGESFLQFLKTGPAPDPDIDPETLMTTTTSVAAES